MKALEYLLNFKTNKATFRDATGNVKTLKESFLGLGNTVTDIQNKISSFAKSQKWANITQMTSTAMSSIGSIANNIKGAFTGAYNFVDSFASEGDKIAKTARILGMSAKEYQEIGFAAERSGVRTEVLETSLKRLSVEIGKAKSGNKASLQMFDALLPKNIKDYKDTSSVMVDLANAYSKMGKSQQSMVSNSLFGRGSIEMNGMLAGGSAELQALFARYAELGGGLTDEMADGSEKFKDDLTDMNVTLKSMKAVVAGALLPAFSKIFKSVSEFFTKNRGTIKETVENIAGKLVGGIEAIIPKIPDVLNGITKIAGAFATVFEILGPVNSLIGVGIVSSIGAILPLVTSLTGLVGGGLLVKIGLVTATLTAWISVFKEIDQNLDMLANTSFKEFCNAIFETTKELINDVNNLLNKAIPGIMEKLGKIMGKATPLVDEVDFGNKNSDINDLVGSMVDQSKSLAAQRNNPGRVVVDIKGLPQGSTVKNPTNDVDVSYGYLFNY